MKSYFLSFATLAAAAPALAQAEPAAAGGDTIVVSASRSGEGVPLSRLGASVTVIDAQAMEERQTRLVSDVLRDVPGLAVNRGGGPGGLTQVRIRGTESNHVLVLVDGIEVSDPYQGEFDFSTLLAGPEARIEVLRGQQSSLYGSDAIGGVIQYITASGRQAPGYSLRAEGGSFGTLAGAARAAGVAGDLDYALTATYYGTDGTPTARFGDRDVGDESVAAGAKLSWAPSEMFKVTGVGRYSWTDADANYSENDPASPLFGLVVDSPGVHSTIEAIYGLVEAELSLLDGRWTSSLSGQIADTRRRGYAAGALDYGNDGQRLKGSAVTSLQFGAAGLSHRMTAAVDVEREKYRTRTPSPFAFQGERHADNVGIVGQYELLAGEALSLGASVRRDENDRFEDATTWRVQGSYALPTGTRLRGAYGTGIKNPGYFELYGYSDGRYIGNPDLRPEKSKGWEVGVEQGIGGRATLGVTWFDSRLDGEIYTDYPAPDFVATPANRTTRSQQHGIEAFVSARPVDQIRIEAAYTWLKGREDGVTEARRPKHVASLNTTVTSADERFAGTLTVRYNGRQDDLAYTDPSYVPVRVSLQDYVLVNLNADYALTPWLTLFGRVDNLFDERYEEVFSFASPGRAAVGGVRARF